MNNSKAPQPSSRDFVVRPYRNGDEARIVDLLNLCFGEWGTVERWQGVYRKYPTFDKDTIIIVEKDGEMIGHRGLHFRDLILQGNEKIYTVSSGDGAIHPMYRGAGIHNRLHEMAFQIGASKDACLFLAWNLKGSITYNHNKKLGFVDIKQTPAYMKIINPEKVFKRGLFDLVTKNQKLRKTLLGFGSEMFFRLGKSEFSIGELLGETDQKSAAKQETIKFIFDESALFYLANFRNRGKYWRIRCLASLVLLGKAKIRFGSFKAFVNLARKGRAILGSV